MMEILHFSLNDDDKYINKNKLALQWPFKYIICGSSGSGKTNLELNLILLFLYYDNLYIYARDTQEPAYQFLMKIFNNKKIKREFDTIIFSSDPNEIIDVDELDNEKQNLIIFDDYVTTKDQSKIKDLFIRGRKKNASIIYLTQSYYDVPKTIRLQCNYISLFPSCSVKDVNMILKEYSVDERIRDLYNHVTKKPYKFFTLDFKNPLMKFRDNFDPINDK